MIDKAKSGGSGQPAKAGDSSIGGVEGAAAPMPNAQLRELKGRAQLLKPMVKLGKEGITPGFLAALDDALARRELVKVKFDHFKERKKELSPQLAEKTGSRLIMRVGNVVVLYRRKPADAGAPGAKSRQPAN